MRISAILVICTPIGLALTSQADATRLIFENESGSNFVHQAYGDNVTTTPQGGFAYGLEAGPTPNIITDYIGTPSSWPSAYGDLINIVWDADGTSSPLTIRLTADPGYLVALHSFEMGAWPTTDRENIPVSVTDGNNAPLFTYVGHIEGNGAADPDSDPNGHTDFDFANPLVAPVINISFNDITAQSAIGIDNIVFSQQLVPEPATALLLLGGAGAVFSRQRRA